MSRSPGDARGLVNPHFAAERVSAPPGAQVTRFHETMRGYAPTPVRSLVGIAAEVGVRAVWLKDESDRFGLPAFKILGASWAVEQALRRFGGGTLIAASAGNHGRAVARCAALRGLPCRIFLPAATSRERAEVIAAEGAEVVLVDGDYDAATAAAELAAAAPGVILVADTSRSPDEPSPAWVVEGYATLFREAAQVFAVDGAGDAAGVAGDAAGAPADVMLVPMGVGSLASAAIRWAVHRNRPVRVIGVEPVAAACVTASLRAGVPVTVQTPGTSMTGLDCATPSASAWPVLRDGLTGTITVGDAEVHQAMRDLAGLGLTIGDCGAAPIAALRRLASDDRYAVLRAAVGFGPGTRVLCIGTEGPTDVAAYRAVIDFA